MTQDEHLKLLRSIAQTFSNLPLEIDEMVNECWIQTHNLSHPAQVIVAARNRLKGLYRYFKTRDSSYQTEDCRTTKRSDLHFTSLSYQQTLDKLLALSDLSSAERDLLYRRFYREETLEEIGSNLNLSKTSVCIMFQKLLFKIREVARLKGVTL